MPSSGTWSDPLGPVGLRRCLFAGALVVSAAPAAASGTAPLDLTVTQIRASAHVVRCELYTDEASWRDRAPQTVVLGQPVGGQARCTFPDVPAGRVAIRVTQDLDADQRVNRGMFRTPQEPWGVSAGGSFGAGFDRASIEHPGSSHEIRMRYTPDLTVLPGAFYGQETGVGFAALATVSGAAPGTGTQTWPSNLTVAAIGTTQKQASIAIWPSLYLGEANDWMLEGTFIAEHFPTRFYGIGQGADSSYQLFARRKLHGEVSVQRRVVGRLYGGGSLQAVAVGVRDIGVEVEGSTGKPLAAPGQDALLGQGVAGEEGSRALGPTATVRFDSRDNVQSTRRGMLARVDLGVFPTPLSTHGFGLARADVRGFVPYARSGTVAGRLLLESRFGDVPFSSMGELGGDNVLRGLFQGRFRDDDLAVAELEVRSPELWRFRLVGFGGAGLVADLDDGEEVVTHPPTWIVGGGLRFELDPQIHNAIRLDVAGGPDGFGFIFNFNEAF